MTLQTTATADNVEVPKATDQIMEKNQGLARKQAPLKRLKAIWEHSSAQKFSAETPYEDHRSFIKKYWAVTTGISAISFATFAFLVNTDTAIEWKALSFYLGGFSLLVGPITAFEPHKLSPQEIYGTRKNLHQKIFSVQEHGQKITRQDLKNNFVQVASETSLAHKMLCARASYRASLNINANRKDHEQATADKLALLEDIKERGLGDDQAQFEALIYKDIKKDEIDQQIENDVLQRLTTLIEDLDNAMNTQELNVTKLEPMQFPKP
jgi:hypothetical protein